jgi:hypothetical protein
VANRKHRAWPRNSEGLPLPHLHRLGPRNPPGGLGLSLRLRAARGAVSIKATTSDKVAAIGIFAAWAAK